MSPRKKPQEMRCAIYTRKSTEEGLEQEFNTLDAQREAGETYIRSQRHQGWRLVPAHFDDGGYSGANLQRPALIRLRERIEAGEVDAVVVYKIDRLTRSLTDFAKLMDVFDARGIALVSVTQQFNTASSMGRLMMHVLLSFAQFEREIVAERTRDKLAAARRHGKWAGGSPVLGYDLTGSKLVVNPEEAKRVRAIFELYLRLGSLIPTVGELERRGWRTKQWTTRKAGHRGGAMFRKNGLHKLLTNVVYLGKVRHCQNVYDGEHEAIVPKELFEAVGGRLRQQRRRVSGCSASSSDPLLGGLVYCTACGCRMAHTYTARGKRRFRYYLCDTASSRGWDQCPAPSLPAARLERFVLDELQDAGALDGPDRAPADRAEMNDQLRRLIERIDYDGRTSNVTITLRSGDATS